MNPDQELCLCFHVSVRKVKKFIRLERPKVASQLSQCYGAGTGCGWCRPFLKRLLEEATNGADGRNDAQQLPLESRTGEKGPPLKDSLKKTIDQLDPEEYARFREQFVRQGKGSPPR